MQLAQYSFTGNNNKLISAEDLPYKMYAVIKDDLVIGYSWQIEDPALNYVLMTYENTPAWINGKYINGVFLKPEEK